MSLFGSLYTGVSALNAQSQSTAVISNNIANLNTIGFKRSEATFRSLVTTEGRSSRFSPGTVAVSRLQRVDQQGPIQQSTSSTDVSLSGNGFFVVRAGTDNPDVEFAYTRNGQFSEDAQGFLRNSAGFFLYGWPLDEQGALPAAQGDLSSLVPVDVAFLGGLTRPTTDAELSINLNSDVEDFDNKATTVAGQALPVPSTSPSDFQRGLRVFDELGSPQDITFELRKIVGPQANTTSQNSVPLETNDVIATQLTGVNDLDEFTITVNGNAATVRIVAGAPTNPPAAPADVEVQTMQDLLNFLNTSYGSGTLVDAELTTGGQLRLRAVNLAHSIDVTEGVGTPLFGANSFNLPDLGGPANAETYAPIDIATTYPGNDQSVVPEPIFPGFSEANTPNTRGWWELKLRYPDGSLISEGLLNFDGSGQLNAASDVDNNIDLQLTGLDWGNGASLQDISIDIERFSQFSGDFNVIFSDQNGAELGLRTGVEIDEDGFVIARFSNGASTRLYQLPVVTFANPNGLNEISGTAYTETDESGEENLREAGRGGAGTFEPATLENSNVDLADEFSRLIISQRAYSAGTRVINTIDELTEDLLRLR